MHCHRCSEHIVLPAEENGSNSNPRPQLHSQISIFHKASPKLYQTQRRERGCCPAGAHSG